MFNLPTVYSPPGPSAIHHILPNTPLQPIHQPLLHWTYPQSWNSANHASHLVPLSDQSHPPPYQSPQPGSHPPIVIDADDFSDDEVEDNPVEEVDVEADKQAAIQVSS